MDRNILNKLAHAAVKAPSGDNCQPWRFKFQGDDSLLIEIVPKEAKSFFDYRLRGSLLSLGAVVENIRTQAWIEGFDLDVDYCWSSDDIEHTIRVQLLPGTRTRVSLARIHAMNNRTVNRRPYLPLRVSDRDIDLVLAEPVEGVNTTLIRSRRDIFKWARVVQLADTIRYSHPVIHEELFDKLRFSEEEARNFGTGLEIDRLGAGPIAKPLMSLIKPWSRMERLSRFGMVRILAGQSGFTTVASGALVLLTIGSDDRELWIKAGERMQRIWILAQEHGYCTQPVTVGLYLDQRFQRDGMQAFFPQQESALLALHQKLEQLLAVDQTGTILFRLGKTWRMKDTAVRQAPEHFFSEASINEPEKTARGETI